MEAASFPVLTGLVLLPAIGAVVVALLPRRATDVVRVTALVFGLLTLGIAVYLLGAFVTAEAADFQFVSQHTWIESWGISWFLGVDGISLFLVVLTAGIFPLAFLGAGPHHDDKPFFAWMLLLEAGALGSFLALDLFLFFVCFEVVLVPMYFIIGGWGYERRVHAATKFFLYTMAGSAFLAVGIFATVFLFERETGVLTFDVVRIASEQAIAADTTRWLFAAFAIAFLVKVPVFPLHTWLPDAHTQAPTAGSVILAAVLLKLGTYGLVRFGLYLFPDASTWWKPTLLVLAVVGGVYGSIVAAMQKDLKRLIAYTSVAHMGFVVLGIFAITEQSLTGGVLQMVNHGLSTGALFFLVGMIVERRHTRQIADLGGIQAVAPVFAGAFLFVTFASIGLPGLNGFVGEFLVLIGSFLTARWYVVVMSTAVILGAVAMLWAYQRVFHGEPDELNRTFPEMTGAERLVLLPLAALIVFVGLYPKPLIDRVEPAVQRLVVHVEQHSDYEQPAVAAGEGE